MHQFRCRIMLSLLVLLVLLLPIGYRIVTSQHVHIEVRIIGVTIDCND